MAAVVAYLIVLLFFLDACAPIPPAAGRPAPRPHDAPGRPGLHVLDPYLEARLSALASLSPRFAAALARLRAGDVPVYIGTPTRLAALPLDPGIVGGRLPPERVAELRIVLEPGTDRPAVLVVRVDLDRLARLVRRPLLDGPVPGGAARFRKRLARVTEATLLHEVWGHLVPVADAGSAAASCADPAPGEPELDSCVMRRENELRGELGWGRRKAYRLM